MKNIGIHYAVGESETFDHAAQKVLTLVQKAQKTFPGHPRLLFVDIDGHRTSTGAYDSDMEEFQIRFLGDFLLPFLTEVSFPLLPDSVLNPVSQRNDVPDFLFVGPKSGGESERGTGRGKSNLS